MTRYSVAIRTLGLNPNLLIKELESVKCQTIKPEKVVVYIAQGYEMPKRRVCNEIYVTTNKGMLTQRALDYEELDTPLIMLLDDDVILKPDSAEKMISAMKGGNYSCIGADVYENHKMSIKSKLYAAFTNLTLPHTDPGFAIKIKDNGSFSYIMHPISNVMDSQSAAGPCSIWYKDDFLRIEAHEEKWIDSMKYAYNEDTLLFHKLYKNGGRIGLLFGSGITHCNGRTASESYHTNTDKFRIRSKIQYILWHRMIYLSSGSKTKRMICITNFWFKSLCMIPSHTIAAIIHFNFSIPLLYIIGIFQGIAFTNSHKYKALRPFVLSHKQ